MYFGVNRVANEQLGPTVSLGDMQAACDAAAASIEQGAAAAQIDLDRFFASTPPEGRCPVYAKEVLRQYGVSFED